MKIEKTLTENEWKADVWIKVHQNEALLKSVLEIQGLILVKTYNISPEAAAEMVNKIIDRNASDLIGMADLIFED